MAVIDGFASKIVLGGADNVPVTNPDNIARLRRRDLARSIQGTQAERITNFAQNVQLAAITRVGRRVDIIG
ncbi:MAG: hypothetical protein D6679_02815 [Candidatus Hydrogenedentota bacterium]|nr:MAG: hypothetical protein D6679_02815 [Candidatus Hydrogenedentota bacterium]